jgi:uncharacterized protein YjbJ (UPF0337 family)
MANPKQQPMRDEASALGDRAAGAMKDFAGEAMNDPSLEREGELQNASGRAREVANEVTGDTPPSRQYVTTLYEDPTAANRAYERLRSRDYTADDIDVVMSDETRRRHFADSDVGTKATEGMGIGGAIGGGVGATLAAIFAVGTSVAIPGLGLVVAGPIAAALAGAGAGAAAGGLIGGLVGLGIPEERARAYDQGVRAGGVVIGARARDDEDAAQIERDFRDSGGSHGSDPNSLLGLR